MTRTVLPETSSYVAESPATAAVWPSVSVVLPLMTICEPFGAALRLRTRRISPVSCCTLPRVGMSRIHASSARRGAASARDSTTGRRERVRFIRTHSLPSGRFCRCYVHFPRAAVIWLTTWDGLKPVLRHFAVLVCVAGGASLTVTPRSFRARLASFPASGKRQRSFHTFV